MGWPSAPLKLSELTEAMLCFVVGLPSKKNIEKGLYTKQGPKPMPSPSQAKPGQG